MNVTLIRSAARGEKIPIERLEVSVYTVPTDFPESDGTYQWKSTTMVLVEAHAAGITGLGYTYADASTGLLIKDKLAHVVCRREAMDVPGAWEAMVESVRNLGQSGIASMAISAVDAALWDLKARLLDIALVSLLGSAKEGVAVYGSGGFTSYSLSQLQAQLGGWVAEGIPRVKMKVGRDPAADPKRVRAAREAIGADAQLFVDANGAYTHKQALAEAALFVEQGVSWFEEPVSSDDLEGLHLIRERAPAGMDVAAGEYGYTLHYFRRMLESQAVDVLQADASRCSITGFLRTGALCEARQLELSGHCAPSLHLHPACALHVTRHLEYFHDHARIEQMLFDGAVVPKNGVLYPDRSRPGMGLELKRSEASRYAI